MKKSKTVAKAQPKKPANLTIRERIIWWCYRSSSIKNYQDNWQNSLDEGLAKLSDVANGVVTMGIGAALVYLVAQLASRIDATYYSTQWLLGFIFYLCLFVGVGIMYLLFGSAVLTDCRSILSMYWNWRGRRSPWWFWFSSVSWLQFAFDRLLLRWIAQPIEQQFVKTFNLRELRDSLRQRLRATERGERSVFEWTDSAEVAIAVNRFLAKSQFVKLCLTEQLGGEVDQHDLQLAKRDFWKLHRVAVLLGAPVLKASDYVWCVRAREFGFDALRYSDGSRLSWDWNIKFGYSFGINPKDLADYRNRLKYWAVNRLRDMRDQIEGRKNPDANVSEIIEHHNWLVKCVGKQFGVEPAESQYHNKLKFPYDYLYYFEVSEKGSE